MNPIVFKRWSNKKWAILASMHKTIIIATLSLAYNIVVQGQEASKTDSSSSPRHLELEEVDIREEAPEELDLLLLAPVRELGGSDLQAGPDLAMDEVLDRQSGIDVRQRGMHGTQADLSIQGGSFDQSMVLLNGFDLSDPQTGHFHLNLPLDPTAMSGVEIRSGAASRTLGVRAFSGAVNFITKPADSSYIGAGALYGQHQLYKAWARANVAGKRVSSLLSASSSGSEGYRENTDFRNHSAFVHSTGQWKRWKHEAMAGFNARTFGANAFYSARFERQYEETSTLFTGLRSEWNGGPLQLRAEAWARVMSDHFLLDRENPDFYQNDHLNRVLGMQVRLQYRSILGLTRSSLRLRQDRILSSSLGEPSDEVRYGWNPESGPLDHRYSRPGISWNLNHSWAREGFSVDAGLLLDQPDIHRSSPVLLPGLDLRYRSGKGRLHAGLNRSYRMPSFTDLFYSGPANVGNPDLKAESAWNLEAGAAYHNRGLELSADSYYRLGRDMIDWVMMEDEKWHTVNHGEVNALGVNLGARWQNPAARGSLALKTLSMQYSHIHMTRVSEQHVSHYLLDHLRHKAVAGVLLQLPLRLEWSLQLRYQDRNGSYSHWDTNDRTYSERPYEAYVLLDSKLSFRLGRFSSFIQVSNLANTPYLDLGNLPQPGRWASAGISFN